MVLFFGSVMLSGCLVILPSSAYGFTVLYLQVYQTRPSELHRIRFLQFLNRLSVSYAAALLSIL
ncbi:hypothetical protein AALP_AA5G153000 [Arabis alpina]|uniref:Uncharacterized protein n=1 Tax=Arabis alpina TaxID=50452 RepID=A0A087GX93_ARAAL|nr:hypothetical protein AALP_AA5G153000 [Arabis alpina]